MIQTDIKFYHSNGPVNCLPGLDRGGVSSNCQLSGGINSLFDDVGSVQSRNGLVDYRCFYIKNTHASEVLRNAKLYVHSERNSGSFIDLGVVVQDEIQTINVSGSKPPEEGQHMILDVLNYGQFTVYYHVNKTIWQGRFQSEIRGIDGLNDAIVSVAGTIGFPTNITFTVKFKGDCGARDLDLINVISHDMDAQTVAASVIQSGSPINTSAYLITNTIEAPPAVNFSNPLLGNPVMLGDLHPGEAFPVWVRRTTPENTLTFILDNFILNVDGFYP